jgi:hypothetical protein
MAAATPSFFGFLATTLDAAIIAQAALMGIIPLVTRHLTAEERNFVIRSGAIFVVAIGGTSTVNRWRDQLLWSDRRSLGHGIIDVYREEAAEGEASISPQQVASYSPPLFRSPPFFLTWLLQALEAHNAQQYRPFFGPLTAYPIARPFGLMKKAITFVVGNQMYLTFNYYNPYNVMAGLPPRPRHLSNMLVIRSQYLARDFWQPQPLPSGAQRIINTVDDRDRHTDTAILVQAAIQNRIPLFTQRPNAEERDYLIRSGSIFVFAIGSQSTIQRWRDDLIWSDRRRLGAGGFDLYREEAAVGEPDISMAQRVRGLPLS